VELAAAHDLRALLTAATRIFEKSRTGSPRLTAEVLLAHAAGQRKEWLYAHGGDPVPEGLAAKYEDLIAARLAGRPTQYITGVQEFYGRTFAVTPDVLIPRPETEHVVEAVLARVSPEGPSLRMADIGTGSGAIAVTLALEGKFPAGSQVFAADLSAAALLIAIRNARNLGALDVRFLRGDLLSCFGPGSLDIVASNPPYVPEKDRVSLQREVRDHEPALALFGGPDGMVNYRKLVDQASSVLRPGGWIVMELAYDAASRVRDLFEKQAGAWVEVEVLPDLAGYPRVIAARRPNN